GNRLIRGLAVVPKSSAQPLTSPIDTTVTRTHRFAPAWVGLTGGGLVLAAVVALLWVNGIIGPLGASPRAASQPTPTLATSAAVVSSAPTSTVQVPTPFSTLRPMSAPTPAQTVQPISVAAQRVGPAFSYFAGAMPPGQFR